MSFLKNICYYLLFNCPQCAHWHSEPKENTVQPSWLLKELIMQKEKKAKKKLQEALEFESKCREQVEQAFKQATTSDSGLRMLKGNV